MEVIVTVFNYSYSYWFQIRVRLMIARRSNLLNLAVWSTNCLSWISRPNPPPLYPDILLFLHQLVSLGMLFKGQYVLLTVSVSLLTDHSIQHSTYLLNVCILSHQWEHCPTCCLQRGLSSHEASAEDSQRSGPNETLEQSRATYWRYASIPPYLNLYWYQRCFQLITKFNSATFECL